MRPLTLILLLAASGPASAGVRSQTLVVADDVADPATLDPQKQFVEKNHTLLQQIFEGLVRFDAEGRLEPGLATSWRWEDDRTLEMDLRRGVVFHDGEPFDAEAVRFSVERYLDPGTGFPAAAFLSSVERVEIAGPHRVRVRMRFPDGILLNRLAAFVLIAPPKRFAREGEQGFAAHPVGTGPFRFVSWEKGREITLEANPGYWAADYPRVKRLVFRFLPPKRQVAELLAGNVDIVTELPGTDTLGVMRSGVAKVVKKLSFYTVGGSINISTGPLSDLRVRRALNHAIDKEELIRYDLLGNGRPIATMSMPGEIGHDPGLRPYAFDLAKARRLLAEAGYPRGVDLTAIIKYQTERSANILVKQLARAGIRVKIHKSPDATLSADIQKGSWDFTFGGCPDPFAHSFFVQSIFLHSESPFSIMRNPEYDRRLVRMISKLDPVEQQAAGMELDRYVHEQALAPFTYQKIRTYGVRKSIRFTPPVTGMPYFYDAGPDSHEKTGR
ncbi:MAG: ABC transporter substrate-binding protein [Elusimicrobia bacterium]|nr:ABC transporter substrate-binding protein [Elusimicrobiota bacterium]